jgi:hypothetical protein
VHVPSYTDLEVTLGKGGLKISGVDGAMQLKAAQTDADLLLTGGSVNATFGGGNVNIQIANRSWRGRNLNVSMATGNLSVIMPNEFNGDIDASVIRVGEIKNAHPAIKEREERNKFTPKLMNARAGSGGALLTFVMGDGTINFSGPPAAQ